MAGLIKMILCIQHKEILPNIRLNNLNPKIRLGSIPALISDRVRPWNPPGRKPCMAGISAFGFSGTNAHIILSEAPPAKTSGVSASPDDSCPEIPLFILALSAKSDSALDRLVRAYATHLKEHPEQNLGDICHTANACRAHFTCRAAFIARNSDDMRNRLDMFLSEKAEKHHIFRGKFTEGKPPRVAFLFSGNSDNIRGTAAELYETLPFFRSLLESCDELVRASYAGGSVLKWLISESESGPGVSPELVEGNTDIIKKFSLFSMEYAFSRLWESWGIRPLAVFGDRTGNYAAASAAGVMSPETAVKYMAGDYGNIVEKHFRTPVCRFISGAGKPVRKEDLMKPTYWRQFSDSPLNFEKGIVSLCEQGCRFFVETGPTDLHFPILNQEQDIHYLSYARSHGLWETLLGNLALLYCSGFRIQWQEFDRNFTRRNFTRQKVVLPVYPFEKRRYWVALQQITENAPESESGTRKHAKTDPLEGNRIDSFSGRDGFEYQYRLSTDTLPELKDTHNIVHVGCYHEMLCRAVEKSFPATSFIVRETEFLIALLIPDAVMKTVCLILNPGRGRDAEFQFYSKDGNKQQWSLHVKGTLELNEKPGFDENQSADKKSPAFFDTIKERCPKNSPGRDFYRMMEKRGIHLGHSVQWVEEIWYKEGEALARFRIPTYKEKKQIGSLSMHPGILDACAQIFHAALSEDIAPDMRYMVSKWQDFIFDPAGTDAGRDDELWCHIILHENPGPAGSVRGAFSLYDKNGRFVAMTRESQMKGLSDDRIETLRQAGESGQREVKKELLEKFQQSSSAQKRAILTDYFQKTMAEILDMPVSELDVKESLMNLGMDSLVGVKFMAAVLDELSIEIPLEDLIQGPGISELADNTLSLSENDSFQEPDNRFSLPGNDGFQEPDELPCVHKDGNESWFACRKKNPDAKVRLFCFPYGMKGASMYRGWQEKLPDHIEICPVQLPGRENRFEEMPCTDMEEMTDMLEKALMPELDRPYAFYGHSGGAIFAFRLVVRLWKNAGIRPAHLFAGGFSSPVIPNPFLYKKIAEFNLAGFQGIPDPDELNESNADLIYDILGERGFEAFMTRNINVMRRGIATLKMLENYFSHKKTEPPFDTPVTTFHGKDDPLVSAKDMEAWEPLTTGPFRFHVLPGDHLFLHEDQSLERLLELIVEALEANK